MSKQDLITPSNLHGHFHKTVLHPGKKDACYIIHNYAYSGS